MEEKFFKILDLAIRNGASDIHLLEKLKPLIRVNSELLPLPGVEEFSDEDINLVIKNIMLKERYGEFSKKLEIDFSYMYKEYRFRVNAYFQKGTHAIAMRLIPSEVPTLEELNLPQVLRGLMRKKQGFVLMTGPTGHGKSTTLAAMIEEINKERAEHIITIEDPIEYYFKPKKSIFSQREMQRDFSSWKRALRSVLREDPNVVFVGEMRDLDSISAALTIAETGHLVFSTLHTNSAAETIDRIVDVFPKGSKEQVRMQLAGTLLAVISQRLIPTIEPGRVPAVELMMNTNPIKTSIREGKTHMIDNIIQTSSDAGMFLLETSLADWVKKGVVDIEVAKKYAIREKELIRNLRGHVE